MIYNGIDFDTYYNNYPDKNGYFGKYGGVYIDEKTPYYLPQGVFYISNPNEVYQPMTRTIKINGVDKWAFLDGTLHGKLSGTYQTSIGVNLFDATKDLLKHPQTGFEGIEDVFSISNSTYYFDFDGHSFTSGVVSNNTTAATVLKAKRDVDISFQYSYSTEQDKDLFYTRYSLRLLNELGVFGVIDL